MSEKHLKILGWLATAMAIMMYVSYFPQIINNLSGHKGDYIQPFVAAINCTLWVTYGLAQKKKDWPIAIANMPGVIFGLTAALTALF